MYTSFEFDSRKKSVSLFSFSQRTPRTIAGCWVSHATYDLHLAQRVLEIRAAVAFAVQLLEQVGAS